MKQWIFWTAAGAAVLMAGGCVDREAQKQAAKTKEFVSDPEKVVTTQKVATQTLVDEIEITGELTSGLDTQVNVKNPGKIVAVYVKDGDPVSAGQLIATQDTSTLSGQLQQAYAQVATANAALASAQSAISQAKRNAAIGPSKSTAALRSAEAGLRSARAQLEKVNNGARAEERRQAEANVASAKQNLETQKKELDRIRTLVEQGALASNRLDQQQNVFASAQAQYNNALESLNLIQAGSRAEDKDAARQAVSQAEENVRTALAQKELDPLLQDQVNAALAQRASAQAQLQAAQAQVSIARTAINDAQIRAPFSGRISGKPIQAGAVPGNGVAVARIVSSEGIYFSGEIPTEVVDQVKPGMPVEVTIMGLEGRKIAGTVASVNPQAESIGRQFKSRIQLTGNLSGAQAGMFARGRIAARTIRDAIIVPVTALQGPENARYVFVFDSGKAKKVDVTTGLTKGQVVEVKGLTPGDLVITQGQVGLVEGARIRTESAKATTKAGGKAEG